MTKEEIAKYLNRIKKNILNTLNNFEISHDPLEKEIEALEEAIKLIKREPCEDCVSRQELLDMATTIETDDFSGNEIIEVVDVDDIKALSSVTPQPIEERHPLSEKYILNKVREEIEDTGAYEQEVNGKTKFLEGITYCLNVIDKYGAESEVIK